MYNIDDLDTVIYHTYTQLQVYRPLVSCTITGINFHGVQIFMDFMRSFHPQNIKHFMCIVFM